MADSVTVGQNGPFGPSNTLLQIWQILADARTGAFPLSVTGGGGGGSGITALTGDVTASGSGSVAATVANISGVTGITTAASILTKITIVGANDITPLTITGGSVTGTGITPFVSIAGTWNTSGNPTALLWNITKTAVGVGYKYFDYQFGGTTFLKLCRASAADEALLSSGAEGTALNIGSDTGALRVIHSNGASTVFVQGTDSNLTFSGLFSSPLTMLTFSSAGIALSSFTSNGPLVTTGGTGALAVSTLKLMTVDTGWTANADAGSKSSVIPSSATVATVQTALNLAVAGAGDLLAATAQKCKALESALAAATPLLPNN